MMMSELSRNLRCSSSWRTLGGFQVAIGLHPGVKVSQNAPGRRSVARKFKSGAFRLQNDWISQPEPTFLGPAS